MSNDVAINLNWTGQGEKMAFKELALRPILESKLVISDTIIVENQMLSFAWLHGNI